MVGSRPTQVGGCAEMVGTKAQVSRSCRAAVRDRFRQASICYLPAGAEPIDLASASPRRTLPFRGRWCGKNLGGNHDVIGAALLAAFSAPALATSSTTTTTTGGATTTTTEQYYVVRDPSTKRCTVTTSKPTGGTTVVVGDTVYKSRSEADAAVTKVCTN